MTRIIAGNAGSLRLDVPKSGTRPTSDRVREAIFSSLTSWDLVDETRVLDLYAGSGALGLEAASRGATSVTFVEKHPPAAQVIERNAKRVREALGDHACDFSVHRGSAQGFLETLDPNSTWDVVFIDPPYDLPLETIEKNLATLVPHLGEGAAVMVEASSRRPEPAWPAGITRFREKKYGETVLWWAEPDS